MSDELSTQKEESKSTVNQLMVQIQELQDNVLIPNDFARHSNHVGSSHDLHSVIQSGLIPCGKMSGKGGMRCSSQP